MPFERVLGPQIGAALKTLHEMNNVRLQMESFLDHFKPSSKYTNCYTHLIEMLESNKAKVGSVVLKDGKSIAADIVILGVGAIPRTDFLKNTSIVLEKDGGITVNADLSVPNVEDIYAVGDIARYPYHLTGKPVRIEHWIVAQNHGRLAAKNIIAKLKGQPLTPFTMVSFSRFSFLAQIDLTWTM